MPQPPGARRWPANARVAGHFGQGVGGVGLGGFVAAFGAGLAEDGLAEGVEGGHDAGADFGVVAAVEVPFALGVGEGPQRASLVDASAAGLGVDTTRRLRPGALLAQLGQGRTTGRLQQIVLGASVGRSSVGDGRTPARPTDRPGGRRPRSRAGTPTGGRCRSPMTPAPPTCPSAGPIGAPPTARPSARHVPASATRAAARPLRLAAIFSIREASSTTISAWAADSRAASNPAAYPLSDSRSSAIPTPIAVPPSDKTSDLQRGVETATTELVFVSYHSTQSASTTERNHGSKMAHGHVRHPDATDDRGRLLTAAAPRRSSSWPAPRTRRPSPLSARSPTVGRSPHPRGPPRRGVGPRVDRPPAREPPSLGAAASRPAISMAS